MYGTEGKLLDGKKTMRVVKNRAGKENLVKDNREPEGQDDCSPDTSRQF